MPISRVRSVTETSITFAMPIAPTRSEMSATEPRSSDSVRVCSFAAFCISVRFRIWKSSSAPSASLWRCRSSAVISRCASVTSCDDRALAMSIPTASDCVPIIRRTTVVHGMSTTSSWSCPKAPWPFAASTPITLHGRWRTRICAPIGEASPKSFSATVPPSTHTFAPLATSSRPNMSPDATGHCRTWRYAGVVPITCVAQFWSPEMTCALVRFTGATASTVSPSSRSMA